MVPDDGLMPVGDTLSMTASNGDNVADVRLTP
jgi:hypothetical protein